MYSSVLQRAFDQILHDVCIDSRPVTFLIDHAGVVGGDGVTHQGIFDNSYLSLMPNLTVLQPKDGNEFCKMLEFSVDFNGPLAIRYPKSYKTEINDSKFDSLCWEQLKKDKSGVTVLAVGNRMLDLALSIPYVSVVNARVIKPLDVKFLESLREEKLIITLEDGVVSGGFGEAVKAYYGNNGPKIEILGHGDGFPSSHSEAEMLAKSGLTVENISKIIKKYTNSLV